MQYVNDILGKPIVNYIGSCTLVMANYYGACAPVRKNNVEK
jgi:hypothetical protein